ncbi:MAG: HAD family hydrolase [Prevotella sp.]|nr:HAD family hydrolase [Prevotella sp.]
MKIKGYIFDYGGTLDTAGCHWGKMLWHTYQEQQVPITEELFREAYIYAERTLGKNPIIQPDYTFRKTLEVKVRIEMEWLEERLKEIGKEMQLLSCCHQKVVDSLYNQIKVQTARSREVLSVLKDKYPLVLVSNFYGNLQVVLEEFGLDGLFLSVVESAVVGIRKPDSRIFMLGVDALRMTTGEVAVVGDSIKKDIMPSKSIGCRTIWLKGEGWTNEPEDNIKPDKIITKLSELIEE